jgi:urease accessory protein
VSHARLVFGPAAGRTILLRQHVPYPFHITRPFHLDPALPDLATLYLQSSSGGLYRADDLLLAIDTGMGARAAVTTQAATMARDSAGGTAVMRTELRLAPRSVLLFTPDPLVLFPGAVVRSTLDVVLADDAVALCADGFACHDPAGAGRAFRMLETRTTIRTPAGRTLVADRGFIEGATLGTAASPLGPYHAAGTLLLLGARLDDAAAVQVALDATGCLAGLSALPNDAGTAIRLLAPDGGRLARGLAVAFETCFRAIFGCPPAPRRK